MSAYSLALLPQHADQLTASGVPSERASARGYVTVDTKKRLTDLGISSAGRNVPGLLIPMLRVDGSTWGYQYRPDHPRSSKTTSKPIKYETPYAQRNGIDVPPGVGKMLGDPAERLWVTEGSKKADCAAEHGLACIALPGVWGWRGTNGHGGKVAVADWADIALNGRRVVLAFDSDVMVKPAVRKALTALADYLKTKDAKVEYCHLPDAADGKTGLDDYLVQHSLDELLRLIRPDAPVIREGDQIPREQPDSPSHASEGESSPATPAPAVPLHDATATFARWLHMDDVAPVLAVAATIVANLAEGDPVWLLIVGPPSGGKTEILSSCAALPYMRSAATISEAALLSGTAKKERAANATGGLLRQVGDFGILLAKDFTSVLSQNKDTAKSAMAALREVYDGRWDRPVGTDGGQVLTWRGKCGFVGGVTPSFDRYAAVVAALGDRFILLRLPDVDAAKQALSALDNGENEKLMRSELSRVMCGLIEGADTSKVHTPLSESERQRLVMLATFAARSRTAVERDGYTGDLLTMPQAEGPARLVKAMRRLYGALHAIGADEQTCWHVLHRVARDCAPAIRLPIMQTLLRTVGPLRTSDVAAGSGLVAKTALRQLDDLAMIGLADKAKSGQAENSTYMWTATEWLREYFPEEVRQRNTTITQNTIKEALPDGPEPAAAAVDFTALRTSLSHSGARPVEQASTVLDCCPICRTPTPRSRAGHASLCARCTLAEVQARADGEQAS